MIAAAPVPPVTPASFAPGAVAFPGHRHVTVGVDAPARGLAIAINLRPERHCNFDCMYCLVDRQHALAPTRLDVGRMASA